MSASFLELACVKARNSPSGETAVGHWLWGLVVRRSAAPPSAGNENRLNTPGLPRSDWTMICFPSGDQTGN